MTMQSVGLISALVGGRMVASESFDLFINNFVAHTGVSDRPIGKRKDVSWRNSKGYRSRKARSNKRKAMR